MKHKTGKKLMFVYDEPDVVNLFRSQFSVLGYDVLIAETPENALELAKEFKPEVIVSEVLFENGVGSPNQYERFENLLYFIEKELPDTKIIVLTVWLDGEQISKWANRIFAVYIKPISFDEITTGIERAFGLKKTGSGENMIVNPIWKGRDIATSKDLCFVLMPFTTSWSTRIWERHLKPTIEKSGFQAQRADDFTGHDIMEDVWKGINKARVVIADITGRNPNVFYELGISHTLGKDVILITQNLSEVPFDINRYRVVEYEDNSDGYDKLNKHVSRYLSALP